MRRRTARVGRSGVPRDSLAALALLASTIHCGSRSDLDALTGSEALPGESSDAEPSADVVSGSVEPMQPASPDSDARCAAEATRLEATLTQLLEALEGIGPSARRLTRFVLWAPAFEPECSSPTPLSAFSDASPEQIALRRLLGSVSTTLRMVAPRAVDVRGRIMQIDLRDYRWNRPLSVAGRRYADGWEALVAESLLGVAWSGPLAERLSELTGSDVPLLFARDLSITASGRDVYYALVEAPRSVTALEVGLGIPAYSESDEAWLRSTTMGGNRARTLYGAADGPYWRLDVGQQVMTGVLPRTSVLYALPNGFPAFFVADEDGERDAAPLAGRDAAVAGERIGSGPLANCLPCHLEGMGDSMDAPLPWGEPQLAMADRDRRIFTRALEAAGALDGAARGSLLSSPLVPSADPLSRSELADYLFVEPDVLDRAPAGFPDALREDGVSLVALKLDYLDALCALHQGETRPPHCGDLSR